jgi:tryptophan synthase beta chain
MKEGIERIATETGAGQWGSALAFATRQFGLDCTIYMVRSSYAQKPYRKIMMQVWGAECIPSPSTRTNSGKSVLQKDPNTTGSLGIAISEAVEDAATHKDTNYSLGSVLNHVCMHQTIIGLEAREQLARVEEYPDVIIGCVGEVQISLVYLFPSPIIFPHVGVGGITPSPKKLKLASVMIAAGIHNVARTKMGERTFGRI